LVWYYGAGEKGLSEKSLGSDDDNKELQSLDSVDFEIPIGG
jgi:hypothetical protein